MRISPAFETRAYPEPFPHCSTENELKVMASLLLRANPGNKFHLIEPDPNPKSSRKVFKNWIFTGAALNGVLWI